jgi:uncharacterized caspase-like protein
MRALIVALSVLGILVTANTAKADRRVAFVAGNGAYKYTQRLPNAPTSAKAMSGLLQKLGFEVIDGIDLTRDEMTGRLLEFGKKAEGADLALLYYSGQGIAIGGSEYLVPIDANIKSEMDVTLGDAINVDLTIDQTMSGAKVKLVFLDASRNNPFPVSAKTAGRVSIKSGLAEMKNPDGTMVAFATGPGQAAPDGPQGTIRPFTRALIAHIAVPGVEIERAMTEVRAQVNEETKKEQMPWAHSNNLSGAVYLVPPVSPAGAPVPAKAPE